MIDRSRQVKEKSSDRWQALDTSGTRSRVRRNSKGAKRRRRVALIVRRPRGEEREVLEEGELHAVEGLMGDNWITRRSSRTADGSPDPDTQLNIMNARVVALVAQAKDRWQLAGDQLYVDMDLSAENLPPGTRLSIGSAIIEVTPPPHTGCKKFVSRFGLEAMQFVNSSVGRELHLRGINARVVQPGVIRVGQVVKKVT